MDSIQAKREAKMAATDDIKKKPVEVAVPAADVDFESELLSLISRLPSQSHFASLSGLMQKAFVSVLPSHEVV
jgi:hypothetical protein